MRKYLLGTAAAALLFLGSAAHATGFSSSPTDVCPAPNGGNSGGLTVSSTYSGDVTTSGSVVTGNTGCNVLITFNSNGSITTTFPNAAPSYDSGGDDNLVGIVNNTTKPISSINLTSAVDNIFSFDGDGICGGPGYTFVEGSACSSIVDTSFGTYGGPNVTYSTFSGPSGTVFFGNGGIAAGGSAFFSLEGPVDLNLQVTSSATPEPGTLMLLGSGLIGLAGAIRRKLGK